MKRCLLALLTFFAFFASSWAQQRVVQSSIVALQDCAIEFRADLTRVTVTLVGRAPNISAKVTSITLNGKNATDVDGIDIGRFFQFESEGKITIEIDFPPLTMRHGESYELVVKPTNAPPLKHVFRP